MKLLPRTLRSILIASVAFFSAAVSHADDGMKWDVAPAVKKSVAPESPKGVKGLVTAMIVIAEDGTVTEAVISKSSDPALEEPVLVAVKQWLFSPAEVEGKPVEAKIKVPFRFQG